MGPDIIKGIQSFFKSEHLLKELNTTTIFLVPKVQNPTSMDDFRPISCCNTIYKCISKLIANRIKNVLPSLADKAQTGFIKGRSITDNILLAQELLRNYHRKELSPRCAIKVDFRKAFDTIRWDFLLDLLDGFKFPPQML